MNRPARPRRRFARWLSPSCLALAGLASLTVAGGCGSQTVEPPRPPAGPYKDVGKREVENQFLEGTIYQIADVHEANTTPYTVSAYGLVGQLRGTGDCSAPGPVRQYMLKELARRGFGDPLKPPFGQIAPADVLRSKGYSIVVVEGDIPVGARKDDWFDVRISSLPQNNTKSLAHGVLFETDLKDAGANRENPSGSTRAFAKAKGPIFVNPAYALDAGTNPAGQAKVSLRNGTIMYNGKVLQDRPITLQLRSPERRMARIIEGRVHDRFQDVIDRTKGDGGPGLAEPLDEGIVEIYVPRAYRGDWEHFLGVVTHLYLQNDPAYNAARAKDLAAAAVRPKAALEDISYCMEGLGKDVLPFIQPLITHPQPDVAFAAARAAAFVGDDSGAAVHALAQMARSPLHPFRLSAIQTLGAMPQTSELNHLVRSLLDSDQATVRIEAYKVLARNEDSAVYTRWIAPPNDPTNEKFALDIVPSEGTPLIYATQRGKPRIAIIGKMPDLRLPLTFVTLNGRLTVSSVGRDRAVTLFYRDASDLKPVATVGDAGPRLGPSASAGKAEDKTPDWIHRPAKVLCQPDAADLIAHLGGAGSPDGDHLDLTYAEVVAVVQRLADPQSGHFYATERTNIWGTSFVLQEPAKLQNVIRDAPVFEAGVGGPDLGTPAPAGPPEWQSLGPVPADPAMTPVTAVRRPVGAPR